MKSPAFAKRLVAFVALVSHALAIVALCVCSMAAPGGAASSCHEPAEGASLSNLNVCCCEDGGRETRGSEFALSLSPDAASFQATATSLVPLASPLTSSETRLRLASHRGSTTPRPPLRV